MKPTEKKQRIFVIDDHALFREGLIHIINNERDFVACGDAARAEDAMKQIVQLKPELITLDVALEGTNGLDLIKRIRDKHSQVRILVLSMHKESLYAERALRAGANGYIMKKAGSHVLIAAIRHVLSGQTYISGELNQAILQRITNAGRNGAFSLESLSDRELEVFRLIGHGYGTRQIADELSISMKTVESHREHIRDKMGLKNTFELVQRAIHQQIA